MTIQSGSLYLCEKASSSPNADSFFSSGDNKLTNDARFRTSQGKTVCPSGYECSNAEKCITWDAYMAFKDPVSPTSTTSPALPASSSSSAATLAVACGVALIVAGAASVLFIRRKKLKEQDENDASSGGSYRMLLDETNQASPLSV
jgi:hypothetical protein